MIFSGEKWEMCRAALYLLVVGWLRAVSPGHHQLVTVKTSPALGVEVTIWPWSQNGAQWEQWDVTSASVGVLVCATLSSSLIYNLKITIIPANWRTPWFVMTSVKCEPARPARLSNLPAHFSIFPINLPAHLTPLRQSDLQVNLVVFRVDTWSLLVTGYNQTWSQLEMISSRAKWTVQSYRKEEKCEDQQ